MSVKELEIFAMATDPIYIGTGGYTIGRVDNTIVRDPITNVPKIPGSSLAGTWRYYVVLEALKDLKDKFPDWNNIKVETGNTIGEKLENYNWKNLENGNKPTGWKGFVGNQVMKITCAGQDNVPQEELANSPSPSATDKDGKTGHCGHCIVCKGFGFSKKDISWQGMLFFSDLEIIFFPVFTIKGTKWITTASRLKKIGLDETEPEKNTIKTKTEDEGNLNLGWLYLEVKDKHNFCNEIKIKNSSGEIFKLEPKDVIIVSEDLFPHIVNSNLEVRTSVSIDPITGAAKEKALFTSEAIPRGTIFYGNVRIFDKENFGSIEPKLNPLPKLECLKDALENSKHFYETLGIGGMTTRGFGRLVVNLNHNITEACGLTENQDDNNTGGGNQNA